MINQLDNFKKKLKYRASYRGTKEMDILLSSFVNKYIDRLDKIHLLELELFLNFEDDTILSYYHYNIVKKKIDKNKISKLFKNFKI
tara:strand:+ start:276 stop:533 length:258 start_codon:yes stop_codon:yes gene_type:complete